jgi:ribonuclease Z
MKIRKRWYVLPVVVLVLAALFFGLRGPVSLWLVKHHVHDTLSAKWFNHLPDSLNVVLCGAGGPMPDLKRSDACTVVTAGSHIFVVDVGPGSVRNIMLSGIPVGRVEAMLLTHYHSDHIGDLGALELQRWINGTRHHPLPIYGPPGVARVVAGFNEAYALYDGYRIQHHGRKIAPPAGDGGIAHTFKTPAEGEGRTVLQEGGLKITAFLVHHGPAKPAVGYRFDYKGRSAVISGDTSTTDNLVHFARGAYLLVSEGLSPQLLGIIREQAQAVGRNNIARIMQQVIGYHTTPKQEATEAQRAGVKDLLFTHITPPLPLRTMESMFLDGVDQRFHGKVQLGRDGTWISLPVGSDQIKAGNRL